MTNNEYSTFTTLLSASKALITTLERADFLDRLILLAALAFFGLVCVYVFKRRVVDKGVRVATALGKVVARGGKGREEVVEEVLAVTTAIVSSLLSIATILPSTSLSHSTISSPIATPTKKLTEREKVRQVEREKERERAEERERRRGKNAGGKMKKMGRVEILRVTEEARAPPSEIWAYPSVNSVVQEIRTVVEDAIPTESPMATAAAVEEAQEEPVTNFADSTPEEDTAATERKLIAEESTVVVQESEEVEEEVVPIGFVESIVDEIRSIIPDFIVSTPNDAVDAAADISESDEEAAPLSASAEPEPEPTFDLPPPTPSASYSTPIDATTTAAPLEPTPEPTFAQEKNPKSRRFEGEAIDPALWSHDHFSESSAVESAETTTVETPIELPTPTPVHEIPVESLEEVVLTATEQLLHPREGSAVEEQVEETTDEVAIEEIHEIADEESAEEVLDSAQPTEDSSKATNEPSSQEEPTEPADEPPTIVQDPEPLSQEAQDALLQALMEQTRQSWADILEKSDPLELEPEFVHVVHPDHVAEEDQEVTERMEEEEEAPTAVITEEEGDAFEIDFQLDDSAEDGIPAPTPASTPTPSPLDEYANEYEEAPAATPASTPEIPILYEEDLFSAEEEAEAEVVDVVDEETLFDAIEEEDEEVSTLISDPGLFTDHDLPTPVDSSSDAPVDLDIAESGLESDETKFEAEAIDLLGMDLSTESHEEVVEARSPIKQLMEERMRDEL